MVDDDMRFNLRKQYFSLGCFCPEHLKQYYDLVGEELPPEEIENRIFTGGPNHYRSQYFKMMGKTLLDFAADMRKTVDRVDKTIRLGACICSSIWDCSGAEPLRLAKTLAGKHTRPFLRIAGAPYHNVNILPIIERSRLQKAWLGDADVELMCEGDTYPRPRYNVPSRPLELFDFAMACDGTVGGMLQYAFDYTHSLSYEQGYAKRLGRNRPVREAAMALFAGKSAVGVEVFDAQHNNGQKNKVVYPHCVVLHNNRIAAKRVHSGEEHGGYGISFSCCVNIDAKCEGAAACFQKEHNKQSLGHISGREKRNYE
jgi:hypothetical protein